jgi:leucyl-tRNA synthetase
MTISKIDKREYKPSEIEPYWEKKWEEAGIYKPDLDKATKPFYNLMMFPYPSAEGMHVGNMYAFTGADVYGRFMRMQGYDVFEPIGLDGFGIHSENYAIKVGQHPREQAKVSESNFYRQLRATGNGFDWSRKVETYDPKYYKWTQWLFIQLFKAGLAYRKKAAVNFCPSCKTVLADEQVVQKVKGQKSKVKTTTQKSKVEETVAVCERCETEVIKKELEQWFFKITKYANRLLNNIAKLDWSEKVKIAQRQWIGRSTGALIRFKIAASHGNKTDLISPRRTTRNETQNYAEAVIEVFTTRPDTLYGATFLVLSPEYPIVAEILRESSLAGSHLEKLESEGKTVMMLSVDGKLAGLIAVADTLKETAKAGVGVLKNMGIEVVMITGDNKRTANAIARKLGIKRVLAEVLPDQKEAEVRKIQAEGKKVAMVGDGINDAPALAAADIGIAMGSGTDVAIEAADITLINKDLKSVAQAINLSKKTMRTIKLNLFWAFGYNVSLIPVAMGVLFPFFGILLNPIFASVAMATSSISVVSNSLLLKRFKI